jgi:hypothetical protein
VMSTNDDFVAGYVIHFSDGGESEEQVLHHGSLESCRALGLLIPAVAYSGKRPVARCEWCIVPAPLPESEPADASR